MSKSIKLNKDLWERVKKCSERAGYSSPEELVEHAIQKELASVEEGESNEEILKKLKGLGYLE